MEEPKSRYDVFLSHGGPDAAWVATVHTELRALGVSAFLDRVDIQGGDNFVRVLSDALDASGVLVLILSPGTADRPWVNREWTSFLAATNLKKRIVPVLLDNVLLPAFLTPLQALSALDRDAKRVAVAIASILGRGVAVKDAFPAASLVFSLERKEHKSGEVLVVRGANGVDRELSLPWKEASFWLALMDYTSQIQHSTHTDHDRAEIIRHATTLGAVLYRILFDDPGETHRLKDATRPGSIPQVVLRSDDDLLLSLPWELLFDGARFLVRDAVVDLARTTSSEVAAATLLRQPTAPFSLVTNVSAPAGSGLDYEAESFRITRALTDHCKQTPTELGTLEDLLEVVKAHRPVGVHFSGHGAPGRLVFENDVGEGDEVEIPRLIDGLRRADEDGRLPRFFYLASCHGNTKPRPQEGKPGSEIAVAQLHRAGVTEVVGYYGPIVDELSTRAEEALYASIADGEATRVAVRRARQAMLGAFHDVDGRHRPDEVGAMVRDASGATENRTHTFAWAQLVLYRRGNEFPLGTPVNRERLQATQAPLHRRPAFKGKGLSDGFIGRRSELHQIRQRLRRGDKVHVLQGLGGLGKTTLALRMVQMLAPAEGICAFWCQDVEQEQDLVEGLVAQLLSYCRKRFGSSWESVVSAVDRQCGDDPVKRFGAFLETLVGNVRESLVLYLDNAESLLQGPPRAASDTPPDPQAFGTWRVPALQGIWRMLLNAANYVPNVHVVASCRYRNADFELHLVPVGPFPRDAMFRLMGWHPTLRRLSSAGRLYLVSRLQGHPRAVEFAEDLVAQRIGSWKKSRGQEWVIPSFEDAARIAEEREQVLDQALPTIHQQLWDDLLLDSLWQHVLDEADRRMLFRMTLLRGSWDHGIVSCLGDPGEAPDATSARFERLAETSLVEQEHLAMGGGGQAIRYSLHPATRDFVRVRFGRHPDVARATHAQVGQVYEGRCQGGPADLEDGLAAGHHLFEAKEYDRACEILCSASDWLQDCGRVREGLWILGPLADQSVLGEMAKGRAGRLLGTLGIAYLCLGEAARAIEHHQQALVISRAIGDRAGESSDLGNLGNAYAALDDMAKAIEHYELALVISRAIGDRRRAGKVIGNLGSAYFSLGDMAKAIEHHQQALVIQRAVGDHRGEGNAIGNLGNAYLALGDVAKAIEFYQQALVIRRSIGDRSGEGSALSNLGNAYAALGDMAKAIEFYQQALVIRRAVGDRSGEGGTLGNLGSAYFGLGDVPKAIEHQEQALVISRAVGDRSGEGSALSNLGIVYAALGDMAKAIEHYQHALVIQHAIANRAAEGKVLGNLGSAYFALGEVGKAIEHHHQALVTQRAVGDRRGEGNTLGNLGNAYLALGDVAKAIEQHEQALVISCSIGDRSGEGCALGNLGNAHAALGDVAKAIELYQQALVLGRQVRDPRIIEVAQRGLTNLTGAAEGGNADAAPY